MKRPEDVPTRSTVCRLPLPALCARHTYFWCVPPGAFPHFMTGHLRASWAGHRWAAGAGKVC